MKINQKIGQFLRILSECDCPGLIMASPGMGKTTTVELYCELNNINLTTLVAAQNAPDDILGIQSVVDGKLVKLTPYWYNEFMEKAANGRRNMLFLDELTTCDSFMQAPLLNLIFNKSLGGGHNLPDNTIIVAAGNYENELDHAFKLSKPTINRYMILNLTPSDIRVKELISGIKRRGRGDDDIFGSDIEEFLGLKDKTKIPIQVVDDIMDVIAGHVKFEVDSRNSTSDGLIGFSSNRSINYAGKYLYAAQELGFLNDYALEVASDSLGSARGVDYRIEFKNILDAAKMKLGDLSLDLKHYIRHPEDLTESIYEQFLTQVRSGKISRSDFDKLVEAKKSYSQKLRNSRG